jgi:hypothetical protein
MRAYSVRKRWDARKMPMQISVCLGRNREVAQMDESGAGITQAAAELKRLRVQLGAERTTAAWNIGGADVVMVAEADGLSIVVDGEPVPVREQTP